MKLFICAGGGMKKSSKWVRLSVLWFSVVALLAAIAVLSCGPAAPVQQAGGGHAVRESVSAPVTDAPFVVQQSGGGDGGSGVHEQATKESAVPATATETPALTVDVAGHPRVGYRLGQHYAAEVRENVARAARGENQEFPVLPVFVKTTPEGEDEVANFLAANGGVRIFKEPDPSVGAVALDMNIGLIPELLGVDGFIRVDLDIQSAYRIPLGKKLVEPDSGALSQELRRAYLDARNRVTRTASRSTERMDYPVMPVSITLWRELHYDHVWEFLRSNGAENVAGDRDGDGDLVPSLIEADISLGLVEELSKVVGVYRVERRIERVKPSSNGPGTGSDTSGRVAIPPSTPRKEPVSKSMRADEWHRAGFTGAGVEVGVIDREFRTRILPHPAPSSAVA